MIKVPLIASKNINHLTRASKEKERGAFIYIVVVLGNGFDI